MLDGCKRLSVAVLAAIACNASQAAPTVHININAVGGAQQTVRVNQQLPQPFVAKVTFDDGLPAVGVNLYFAVNACASLAPLPSGAQPCPDPAVYGHFLNNAMVTTGLDGTATSTVFVAGKLQGSYSVYAGQADWSQVVNGQTLSNIPITSSSSDVFQITQLAAGAAPMPVLSAGGTLTLIGMLGLAAYFVRRRRTRS
jgi:hypothetical protein